MSLFWDFHLGIVGNDYFNAIVVNLVGFCELVSSL